MTPTTLAIDAGQIGLALLLVFFLIVSLVMILIVLVQRPQGGGLSGAFGGSAAGSSQTAFGARTGDVLTLVTIGIFLIFLSTAVALNYMVGPPTPVNPTAQSANDTPTPAGAPAGGATDQGGAQQPGEGTTPPAEAPTEPPAEGETTGEQSGDEQPAAQETTQEQQPAEEPPAEEPPAQGLPA